MSPAQQAPWLGKAIAAVAAQTASGPGTFRGGMAHNGDDHEAHSRPAHSILGHAEPVSRRPPVCTFVSEPLERVAPQGRDSQYIGYHTPCEKSNQKCRGHGDSKFDRRCACSHLELLPRARGVKRLQSTGFCGNLGPGVVCGQGRERGKIFGTYQVNAALVAAARSDVLVVHCLLAHGGAEITDEVIEGPHSVVFDQAENRLHAQSAVLALLMGR